MELSLITKLLFHLIMEMLQINVELLPNILNLVNSELIVISIKLMDYKEQQKSLLTQLLLLKPQELI
jgi:hypothetical protein